MLSKELKRRNTKPTRQQKTVLDRVSDGLPIIRTDVNSKSGQYLQGKHAVSRKTMFAINPYLICALSSPRVDVVMRTYFIP